MKVTEKIKEIVVEAAREAGKYALQRIGDMKEIAHKTGRSDLVTDVDKSCEDIIIGKIKKEFPSHSILAEESGEQARESEYKWLIDPLDGTTNYAHGFPVFCASIGVMFKGSVIIGAVYDPSRDELFFAEEGKGALLNNKKIKVSTIKELPDSLFATGFAYNIEGKMINLDYFRKMLERVQAVRRAGAAALDLCYVACGRLDGFWELGLNPWDTAAGMLIVQEAGGKVTTMKGDPYNVFEKDVAASNGRIHAETLKALNQ